MDLVSRAPKLAEASKDQTYNLLQPQVWIEANTDLAMPDEAHRAINAPRDGP